MIQKIILLSCAFLFFAVSTLAFADEHVTKVGDGETYIAVDEENNAIIFVIKREKKALLDEQGLHVFGDVDYDGVLVDIGNPGFDRLIDESREESYEE